MHKTELVSIVSARTGISKSKAEEIITATTDTIMSIVRDGNSASLAGFGVFKPKKRASRIARNINTHEPIFVPARVDVVFEPGAEFRTTMRSVSPEELSE